MYCYLVLVLTLLVLALALVSELPVLTTRLQESHSKLFECCCVVPPGAVTWSSVDIIDGAVCHACCRPAGTHAAVDKRQSSDSQSAGIAETHVARVRSGRCCRRQWCSSSQLYTLCRQHRPVVHRAGPPRSIRNVSNVQESVRSESFIGRPSSHGPRRLATCDHFLVQCFDSFCSVPS